MRDQDIGALFHAGDACRHAVQHRVTRVEQLKDFAQEGYRFVSAASEPDHLVFRRDQA